jgi:hypothetical protein
VTVVDSGLDVTHPEFANRANTELLNRQSTAEGDEDHGTEVSSVVAAPNNGLGVVGVYPDAMLRVWDASPFGALLEGSAIQGIREAAIRGPGVINLSFGGDENDPLLQAAVMFAVRSGSLVVAAAGNGGGEGSPPEYPAAYPHVLSVGATNESGNVAAFSTIGPTLDLVAPGVRIYVAEPLSFPGSTGYDFAPGTSFAAPMVAGAAAWVWTERPDLDNTQLFELMRRSATDIGRPGFDLTSGYGLLDIPAALSYRTPFDDPQEPNEQPSEIEPKRLFSDGMAPLTAPGHLTSSLRAHVDRNEDPLDLYRIWTPPRLTVRVRAVGRVHPPLETAIEAAAGFEQPLGVRAQLHRQNRPGAGAHVPPLKSRDQGRQPPPLRNAVIVDEHHDAGVGGLNAGVAGILNPAPGLGHVVRPGPLRHRGGRSFLRCVVDDDDFEPAVFLPLQRHQQRQELWFPRARTHDDADKRTQVVGLDRGRF